MAAQHTCCVQPALLRMSSATDFLQANFFCRVGFEALTWSHCTLSLQFQGTAGQGDVPTFLTSWNFCSCVPALTHNLSSVSTHSNSVFKLWCWKSSNEPSISFTKSLLHRSTLDRRSSLHAGQRTQDVRLCLPLNVCFTVFRWFEWLSHSAQARRLEYLRCRRWPLVESF